MTTWRWLLTLGLILTEEFTGLGRSAAGGSPPSRTESNLQIVVRVHNNVHMQPDILARAEVVATQILRKAGVWAVWLDCSTTVAAGHKQPLCDRTPEPTDLFLDFDEEIQSLSPDLGGNALGFAAIPRGGQGDRAYISSARVHNTARRFGESSAMIFGLAAAHEIGHLLMDSGDHSPWGLMRAGWDANDLSRAAKGDLLFTNDQVKKIHAGLSARMTHQRLPR